MEWIGMEWSGLDWIGMEWTGTEWSAAFRRGLFSMGKVLMIKELFEYISGCLLNSYFNVHHLTISSLIFFILEYKKIGSNSALYGYHFNY